MDNKYTIGLDFGTLSARAIIVRLSDGKIIASHTYEYPHGVIDKTHNVFQFELDEHWALQYPDDYIIAMKETVSTVIKDSHIDKNNIIGIGVDFTACTMLPIDEHNVPLCNLEKFQSRKNAYVKLWKHHGAQRFADRINEYLSKTQLDKSPLFGGRISSELLIPKIVETLDEDEEIYNYAYQFIEAGDWITRVLTDSQARSISLAGYKSWYDSENKFLEKSFFKDIDVRFENVVDDKLTTDIRKVNEPIGTLNKYWAEELGLNEGIVVAPAIIDSHAGVPGSGLCNHHSMMLVLGTSSVMIAFSKHKYSEFGIYGNIKDAIIPNFYGYESGLAGVGDVFHWFVENQVPYSYYIEAKEKEISIHELLTQKASLLEVNQSGLIALDWFNGNKTPYVNSNLKGMIYGLTLSTKPEEIYRALIEATAFGTRQILEIYEEQGIVVDEIICSGGISYKNPLLMQIYADVLGKTLKIADSTQTAALGSAIYAAIAAKAYDNYEDAVKHMAHVKDTCYKANEANKAKYDELYKRYKYYGEIFSKEK